MHASFPRTLGVVGLLAVSLTGCQSASLGNFSWNPKNWKWGRKPDTALAANNTATTADSTANPWTPQLPSQTATPGYGAPVANNGYGPTSNQYSTATYPAVPTNYSADASQGAWGAGGATAAPAYDPNAYAAAPATPQTGYYGDYGQTPPSAAYTQTPPSYGAAQMTAPMTQPSGASWDPATQYGPAPTGYPPQPQYGAPTAQLADNTQYPNATQYDGTQPSAAGAQPAYGTQPQYGTQPAYNPQPSYGTGSSYDAVPATQPQGAQPYPPYQPATGGTTQPYRPGGTSDYAPPSSNPVTPASYDPSQSGAPAYNP